MRTHILIYNVYMYMYMFFAYTVLLIKFDRSIFLVYPSATNSVENTVPVLKTSIKRWLLKAPIYSWFASWERCSRIFLMKPINKLGKQPFLESRGGVACH